MGANAVTTVPVYVAGEILTAADLNITNSGIPVFASTVERDAAFGGTGEKTLAEGQFAYLETGDVTQYYDGAVWQTVGITPGLVATKAETAFSAVSSFSASNVFTSSYTNYIMLVTLTASAGSLSVNLQLSVGGVAAATNYSFQKLAASSTTVSGARSASQTSYNIETHNDTTLIIIELGNPAEAATTTFQTRTEIGSTSTVELKYSSGNHTTATAYDGVVMTTSSGTMTGKYAIYGYSKS
jgi:hypothetical protein